MKTVLLIVWSDSQFVELSRVAKMLQISGRYRPIFWFLSQYPALVRDVNKCKSEGWEFYMSVSPPSTVGSPVYSSLKLVVKLLPRKIFFWLFFIPRLLGYRKVIMALVKNTVLLIQKYQPTLLIICEENVGYASHIPIRISRARNIPTVVIPYTIANATEPAEFFYNSVEHKISGSIINQLVAKKYPHWVYEHRGRKLLRLPAATIIPMEQSGYSPAHPWKINSEETTFIAVENERMLEYYRNEGLPEERLILSGALYDDVLAESARRSDEMRNRLIVELGLNAELPLLLCALPPSQFPRDCEFAEYGSLVSFWMETLSQVKGWNVIVRPHPRLTEEEIDQLKPFGVKISNWDTASLIPLCDLYVASVSATIRWAIACGKPVVNYDVYQMNYDDYKNVDGVINVFSKSDFRDTINRLTSDRGYHKKISALQHEEMSRWGRLDGKSSERIMQLFDDVISGKIRRNVK